MSRIDFELTVGPLMFLWSPERIADFYRAVANSPDVARVYLGEVVCGKRAPLAAQALAEAAECLDAAGKEVVWAGQAMPATPREAQGLRDLATLGVRIEINDFAALASLPPGTPFVAGPLLSLYNEAAVGALIDRGCERLCPNVELSLDVIGEISRAYPALEIELFAYGRMPLALSGRCYHARARKLHKDKCLFACEDDPDGMAVRTLEGEALLAVNGIQTLSHGVELADLAPEALRRAGVTALRISPHTGDAERLLAAFGAFAHGASSPTALREAVLAAGPPGPLVNGYLHGRAGHDHVSAT